MTTPPAREVLGLRTVLFDGFADVLCAQSVLPGAGLAGDERCVGIEFVESDLRADDMLIGAERAVLHNNAIALRGRAIETDK
jgi:hypothetical protein